MGCVCRVSFFYLIWWLYGSRCFFLIMYGPDFIQDRLCVFLVVYACLSRFDFFEQTRSVGKLDFFLHRLLLRCQLFGLTFAFLSFSVVVIDFCCCWSGDACLHF